MSTIITSFAAYQPGDQTITLYHGTSHASAAALQANGWQPRAGSQGGNMGNPAYLYLTSGWEDAQWFANEKGESAIVQLRDVPLAFLRPDPEDEAGFTMAELLERIAEEPDGMPSKFILTKPLPASHFVFFKDAPGGNDDDFED